MVEWSSSSTRLWAVREDLTLQGSRGEADLSVIALFPSITSLVLVDGTFSWPLEAFKYVDAFGIVSESVFSNKFTLNSKLTVMVTAFFGKEFSHEAKLAAYKADPELLHKPLAELFGANVPRPNDPVVFEGKTYTPLTFEKERHRGSA
jgi:hypothetical protein